MAPKTARGRGRLHLGTSGFGYDAWKGPFYPQDLKAKDMLAYYAARFSSVEINYTFRRFPTEKPLLAWRAATPPGFSFALKAHMKITNAKGLVGVEQVAVNFVAALAPLGDRTGPVLLQYPPHLAFDEERIVRFLDALPATVRWVVEASHASWAAAQPLCASRGIAWCASEGDDQDAPAGALEEGPFHYLRLRKAKYTKAALGHWAARIRAALDAGRDVHCYFKHEDEGTGPRFAALLGEMVGP